MIGWGSKLCSKPPLLNTLHKQIHITHHHGTYVGPPFTQTYTKQTNKQRQTHCKWTRGLIDWSRVVCSDPSPPEPCWHPSMGPISPLQLPCQPHRDEGRGGGGGWLKERGTSCPGNEDPQALPFIGTAPSVCTSTLIHIITKFEFANVKVPRISLKRIRRAVVEWRRFKEVDVGILSLHALYIGCLIAHRPV